MRPPVDGRSRVGAAWGRHPNRPRVTARPWNPRDRAANHDLLDEGTLYTARFDADGTGEWLPLVHGVGPINAANGFRDQAEVLVKARFAADAVGATRMDRPEWIVPHPGTREVYCACTNNAARGRDRNEGPNSANRRANNVMGHIVRWREAGNDPAATRFQWDVFVEAGDPAQPERHTRREASGATSSVARTGCGWTRWARSGSRPT